MNIGSNLKVIRATKKISQKELAEKVGITPAYLSMIENNSKRPSLSLIEKISQTLEVPLTMLFGELNLVLS